MLASVQQMCRIACSLCCYIQDLRCSGVLLDVFETACCYGELAYLAEVRRKSQEVHSPRQAASILGLTRSCKNSSNIQCAQVDASRATTCEINLQAEVPYHAFFTCSAANSSLFKAMANWLSTMRLNCSGVMNRTPWMRIS